MPDDDKIVHTTKVPEWLGDLPKTGAEWLQFFYNIGYMMQPTFVLTLSGRLDLALKEAILAKMRPLSNTAKQRLFDGYGPLSSFSSKIDIGYGLSLFDEQVYSDLKVIKEVRNEFAHPSLPLTQLANFACDPILSIFKKLKDFDIAIDHPMLVFIDRQMQCLLAVSNDQEDIKLATKYLAGRSTFKKPEPSP